MNTNNSSNSIEDMAGAAKNISETAKNFSDIIKSFISPSPIDEAIYEGYKDFIKKIIASNPPTPELLDFLNGFKQIVKQERRKKDVAEKARQFLEDCAKPQNISEDWFDFFFEKAKLVSNEEMKLIWSKVLAEEANYPGKIKPSLLHALSIMTYEQAQFFCNISRFALRAYKKQNVHLLVFISKNRDSYEKFGITPRRLRELDRLGLIDCDFEKEKVFKNKVNLVYGRHLLTVYGDENYEKKIKAGNLSFTDDGQALYDIIDNYYKEYQVNVLNFIIDRFKARNCKVILDDREI